MKHDIKILCPSRKCGKCLRMIAKVEEAAGMIGVDANIQIVDRLGDLITYKTWILPTLVIDGKYVARGYVPDVEVIIGYLKP